ncbi:MAG TPA: hypothetical protein VJH67_01700 [Candidatus Paceibacterota bacterium]
MEKTDQNYMEGLGPPVLSVSVFDTMDMKDRVTFDSELVQGIQITYWPDDLEYVEEKVNSIFDIFFEEVLKNRNKGAAQNDPIPQQELLL